MLPAVTSIADTLTNEVELVTLMESEAVMTLAEVLPTVEVLLTDREFVKIVFHKLAARPKS